MLDMIPETVTCKICGGKWLDKDKFEKHLTLCSEKRSTIYRTKEVITKKDLKIPDFVIDEIHLLKCKNCRGTWIDEEAYKNHIKTCKGKHMRIVLPKIQLPPDLSKSTDMLQNETNKIVEFDTKVQKVHPFANTTPLDNQPPKTLTPIGQQPQTDTGDTNLSGTSKPDFLCEKESDVMIKESDVMISKVENMDDADSNVLFECDKCQQMFITEDKFTNHDCKICLFDEVEKESGVIQSKGKNMDETGDGVLFECDKCMQMFVTEDKFSDHTCETIKKEPTVIKYQCRFCDMGFINIKALENHSNHCHSERSVTCKHCFTKFMRGTYYDNHLQMHANIEAGISFKCTSCNKVFYTEVQLKCHENDKHGTHHFPYVCGVCGKAFRRTSNLDTHNCLYKSPYRCGKCFKTFTRKELFTIHMEIHKNQEMGTSESCLICEKSFTNKISLKKHERCHNVADNVCDVCGKVFNKKENLTRHKLIHKAEKPHKCLECGKQFSDVSNLKKHTLLHSGIKPYECDTCGRSFVHKASLKLHKQNHHKE